MSGSSLADRARRVAGGSGVAAAPAASGEVTPVRMAAPRTAPVRVTTDLAPQMYRSMTDFASEAAVATGRPRVFHTDILRALLAELETSSSLQAAVLSRLRG